MKTPTALNLSECDYSSRKDYPLEESTLQFSLKEFQGFLELEYTSIQQFACTPC